MECPIVETSKGKVSGAVGKSTDPDSKFVFRFLGIPFGKPTTGERRFAPPESCDPWDEVKDCSKPGANPPQDTTLSTVFATVYPKNNSLNHDFSQQSEDSLLLNVFTPTCTKTAKLPVMVYVVGGGYTRAFALREDGTAMAGMNDVVIVCANYRPNAFGFLSLGKGSAVPGNMALYDVILALGWVQDNIRKFGGDPTNVTLFGESAGSVIIQLLSLSKKAEHLFHKAIMMSGSALFPAMFQEDCKSIGEKFIENLGISIGDNESEILRQVRAQSAEEILKAQTANNKHPELAHFKPTVDGAIVTEPPQATVKRTDHRSIPIMTGVGANEMGGLLSLAGPPNFFVGSSRDDVRSHLVMSLSTHLRREKFKVEQLVDTVLAEYEKKSKSGGKFKYSEIFDKIVSDMAFNIPMVQTALSNTAPTYVYVMDHQPEFNHSISNGPDIRNKPDFVTTDHGDVIHYVWGAPFIPGELSGGAWFTDGDRQMSRLLMTYVTNFAKTSDPNQGAPVDCEWPKFTGSDRQHLVLSIAPSTDSHFMATEMELFNKLFTVAYKKS